MIVNRYLDCPAVEVVASAPWRIAGGELQGVDRLGRCMFVDVVQAVIAEDQGVADGVGGEGTANRRRLFAGKSSNLQKE